MNSQDLYISLGQLIAAPPKYLSISKVETPSAEVHEWMGKAFALVQESGALADAQKLALLHGQFAQFSPSMSAPHIFAILYRTLAVAELRAPASARGAFINAGNALDAMAAVGKVVGQATATLRIVDPYMDDKTVTDFAVLASPAVSVELLADTATVKASLQPAVARWKQQFPMRSIELRLAPPRTLHDRLIVLDGAKVWTLTQSLNAFAARSPASILLVDSETAALKLPAYDSFWVAAALAS